MNTLKVKWTMYYYSEKLFLEFHFLFHWEILTFERRHSDWDEMQVHIFALWTYMSLILFINSVLPSLHRAEAIRFSLAKRHQFSPPQLRVFLFRPGCTTKKEYYLFSFSRVFLLAYVQFIITSRINSSRNIYYNWIREL